MSSENSPAISDSESKQTQASENTNTVKETKTPPSKISMVIQNLGGVVMSGAIAFGLYLFTNSVALKLAQNPLTSNNNLTMRVSTTVRTFLLALGTGATMIFAVVSVGILLLTIQELFKREQQS